MFGSSSATATRMSSAARLSSPAGRASNLAPTRNCGSNLDPAANPCRTPYAGWRFGSVRHLAFQVDDVDALLQQMGDAAQVNLGPIDFDGFIPGWRSVWLTDPDGVVVEVSQGYRDEL